MKHGGGSVMAWECMAANGTTSLVFIDDGTADKSSRMNSEMLRAILSPLDSAKCFKTHWTALHSADGQ